MGEEELSTAWDKTKKDARRQAAELAVRGLVANGGFGKFSSLATSVSYLISQNKFHIFDFIFLKS